MDNAKVLEILDYFCVTTFVKSLVHRLIATLTAFALLLVSVACDSPLERTLKLVTAERLRDHVDVLADDIMEGRVPSSAGHILARRYIEDELVAADIESAGQPGLGYLHTYPTVEYPGYPGPYPEPYTEGHNIAAVLRGSDPAVAHEYVLVMAHYDHLGTSVFGNVFNGAYDNAAGVAILLELARGMRKAGYKPRRSIVFLFTDEEENFQPGSSAWADNPSFGTIEDIVFAVSVDPIGRPSLPGFMWTGFFGLENSPTLEAKVRELAPTWGTEDVVLGAEEAIEVFHSDHLPFLESGVPAAWMMTPGFSFYHQPSDEAETIDYRVVLEATRVLAGLVDLVANQPERDAFVPSPGFSIESVIGFRRVFERFLTADVELCAIEECLIQWTIDGFTRIETRGFYLPEEDDAVLTIGLMTIFALSLAHPGPIPPPFPEGGTAWEWASLSRLSQRVGGRVDRQGSTGADAR